MYHLLTYHLVDDDAPEDRRETPAGLEQQVSSRSGCVDVQIEDGVASAWTWDRLLKTIHSRFSSSSDGESSYIFCRAVRRTSSPPTTSTQNEAAGTRPKAVMANTLWGTGSVRS